jgi:hypothetical protein
MAFYVAVGPRGLLFRVGMMLTGVMGPPTYWWGSRRRRAAPTPWSGPDGQSGAEGASDLSGVPARQSAADSRVADIARRQSEF